MFSCHRKENKLLLQFRRLDKTETTSFVQISTHGYQCGIQLFQDKTQYIQYIEGEREKLQVGQIKEEFKWIGEQYQLLDRKGELEATLTRQDSLRYAFTSGSPVAEGSIRQDRQRLCLFFDASQDSRLFRLLQMCAFLTVAFKHLPIRSLS